MSFFHASSGITQAVGASPAAQCVNLGTVFNTNAASTRAEMSVQRNGQISTRRGATTTDNGDFVASGLPDATIGDLYEVQVNQLSGDALSVSAGLASFLQINGFLNWNYNDTPGAFKQGTFNYQIREIADVSNISALCTFTLETEDGS